MVRAPSRSILFYDQQGAAILVSQDVDKDREVQKVKEDGKIE